MADAPSEKVLEALLSDLLDRGVREGKIPPAQRKKWGLDIRARGNGKLTPESIAWATERLNKIDPIVTVAGKEHRPPHPDDYGRLLAQSIEPGPPIKPPSADWSVWGLMNRCKLWEAVVLTLDFEPTYFAAMEDGRGGLGIVPQRAITKMPAEAAIHLLPPDDFMNIHRRLRVAISQPTTVIRPLDFFIRLSADAAISLPDFGVWAKRTWPTDFPSLFPTAPAPPAPVEEAPPATQPSKSETTEAKPLATKERTTLLAIIGGLAKLADLDISHPTTAANKIRNALQEMGVDVKQRTVEEWLKRVPDALDHKST